MENKKVIKWIILLVLCAESMVSVVAQDTRSNVAQDTLFNDIRIPKEITDAFKVGNSRIIRTWLSDRTLISIEGRSKLYSPAQAQALLKKFFSENPPMKFETIHQGISQKETGQKDQPLLYYIAIYHSKETYRTYLLVKQSAKKFYIRSISLDKQSF